MRETFKSLINYANNSDRFENVYDGWIESLEEELVVLEVYSVILKTQKEHAGFVAWEQAVYSCISPFRCLVTILKS